MAAIPAKERFAAKINQNGPLPEKRPELGPCWLWTGSKNRGGYGMFRHTTKKKDHQILAHRFSYQLSVGQIPKGLEIDHLCRNRGCVNPCHLEAVTRRENALRGDTITAKAAQKTHCPAGHPYDENNTNKSPKGHRRCRECHKLLERKRRKEAGAGPRRERLLTWNGETKTLTEWAAHLGINHNSLFKRLSSRWSIEEAFTTPTRTEFRNTSPTLTWHGVTMTIAEWGRQRGLTYHTIWNRLNRGWSVHRTLSTPQKQ